MTDRIEPPLNPPLLVRCSHCFAELTPLEYRNCPHEHECVVCPACERKGKREQRRLT